jgi:RNA polymerase sigma factor (sigma-70 family)
VNLQLLTEGQDGMNHLTDSVVWKDLLGGDKKALAIIYTRYFDNLYNYGAKISKDSLLVEDAIQDLFVELWNRRERLDKDVKSIKFYLYVCLRRKIVQKLTKNNSHIDIDEIMGFDLELSHKSHYLNSQINHELRQKLIEVIETLTPKQKEALCLIYFDELSYPEVATIMDLKIKTIYNLVHQAVSKLKERKQLFWNMISLMFF